MRENSYNVRRYQPQDKADIIRLVESVWNPEAADRLVRMWDWKYDHNPHNPPNGHNSLVLELDGQLVGFMGYIAADLKVGDQVIPVAWGSDLSVDPRHRGNGWLMLKYLRDHSEKFVLGSSIPEKIYQIYIKLGGIDVATFMVYKRVLGVGKFLRAKHLPWFKVLPGVFALRAAALALRVWRWRPTALGVKVRPITRFDGDFDAFWAEVSPGYDIIAVRNAAALNWRFCACPNRQHTILRADRHRRLAGYVVVRHEHMPGFRRGFVVDILTAPDDDLTFQVLLDAAERHLRKAGVDVISLTGAAQDGRLARLAKRNGYLFKKAGTKMTSHAGQNEEYRRLMPKLENAGGIYLTRGDTDMDYSY